MQITIPEEWAGRLLRDFLRSELKLSTKMLKYLKYRNEGICVGGERRTVRYVLQAGDVLTIVCKTDEPKKIKEELEHILG